MPKANSSKLVDIKYRAYSFSVSVIKYLRKHSWTKFDEAICRQLLRSATSVGANIVEGRSGNSDREMIRFYRIALKSANETKYWLCLLRDGVEVKDEEIGVLLIEAEQIAKILAASILTLQSNQ